MRLLLRGVIALVVVTHWFGPGTAIAKPKEDGRVMDKRSIVYPGPVMINFPR